jgi:hypothetical protein
MSVQKKLQEKGFIYNKSGSSMSKRGSHKLDPIIADAYVKFGEIQTEVYQQTENSWNYLLLDVNYNIISEQNLTEEEILNS